MSEERAEKSPGPPSMLYFAQGVLPSEEPVLKARIHAGDEYGGVRVPFNFQSALLQVDGIAKNREIPFTTAACGIGRIIRKFGLENAKKIFEGKGTEDQNAYLERIIQLEGIRDAVARAVIETLDLSSFVGIPPITKSMLDDSGMRDAVLGTTAELMSGHDTEVVPFFGRRILAEDVVENILPKRHRENPNINLDELLYPMAEAALADYLIRERNGLYVAHRGGDLLTLTPDRDVSTSECLREFAVNRLGDLHGQQRRDLLSRGWEVTADLDGLAFYQGGSHSRDVEHCDPYYYSEGYNGNGGDGGSAKKPYRVPMMPWETSWATSHMGAGGGKGGVRTPIEGQAAAVATNIVNPVIRRYLARLMGDVDTRVLLREICYIALGEQRYSSLEQWKENRPMPDGVSLGDYNDLVRLECEAVSARALKLIESAESGAAK